jgi:hypothetical protein
MGALARTRSARSESNRALLEECVREFVDFCTNTMPARGATVEIDDSGERPSRLLLHLDQLLQPTLNADQWNAAYHIARRFGFDPSRTRWQALAVDARGLHAGVLVFERLVAAGN